MQVAIIGAGAAGLNAIKNCQDPEYSNITCEVFEQTNQIGGTWYFTENIGVDKDGLPVHTSMYEGLRTNLPKEVMLFPGFKYPEYDYSFITQEEVFNYVESYVEKYQLRKFIKFHSQVTNVSPIENNRWSVTVKNLKSGEVTTKNYDAVMICNGHYSTPNIPNIPGTELFKGKIIHSHYYRSSKPYKDQKVLVLGAGSSGRDIAIRVAENAKKVYLSHRKPKFTSERIVFPENVEQVPALTEILENNLKLADNTSLKVDSIIWCTGYKYDFPFLSDECKIKIDQNWVKPLYKHTINIEYPTMAFIGLQFSVCPFLLFDFQNRFFLNYLNNKISLPTNQEMYEDTEKDLNKRFSRGMSKRFAHYLGTEYQQEYFDDIAKVGKLKPLPPVYTKIHAFIYGKTNRSLRFRIIDDQSFSVF